MLPEQTGGQKPLAPMPERKGPGMDGGKQRPCSPPPEPPDPPFMSVGSCVLRKAPRAGIYLRHYSAATFLPVAAWGPAPQRRMGDNRLIAGPSFCAPIRPIICEETLNVPLTRVCRLLLNTPLSPYMAKTTRCVYLSCFSHTLPHTGHDGAHACSIFAKF